MKATASTIQTKTILSQASGFISSYDYVINPYMGCTFGCDYCYASNFTGKQGDGRAWGDWVKIKSNAGLLLESVKHGSLSGKTIYISTATDPYQPVEREYGITQNVLTILGKNHPGVCITIQTRAPAVTRDIGLFQGLIESGSKINVNMTITTDSDLAREAFEPGCPSIAARIKAVSALGTGGIPTTVTVTPMLPMYHVESFVHELSYYDVKHIITQPFRPQRSGSMVATTDERAMDSLSKWYNQDISEALATYQKEYETHLRSLRSICKDRNIKLGIGESGFAPPF